MRDARDTDYLHRSVRASAAVALWTVAWTASLALARFGPDRWDSQPAAWAAVSVNLAIGLAWIVAFTRYLRVLDELERKIVLEALAVALGAGWVLGFGHVVADRAELLGVDVDLAALPAFMGVVFMLALAVGRLRYR